MKLGSLVIEFLSDTSNFKKGVKDVQMSLDGTVAKTKETSEAAKGLNANLLLLGTTATAAGYAIYASIEKYGALADEINDLSLQTGATSEKLQQMKYASLLSNTEFSKVTFGVNNLALAMEAAKDSTSSQAKAFRTLGVDPTGKSPADVFDEVSEAIMDVKDETTRAGLANALYGKSWKELIPYMETYIEKRDEIKKAPIFSQKELDDMEEAKIRMDKFTGTLVIYGGKALAIFEQLEKYNPVRNIIEGLTNPVKGITGGADYYGKKIAQPEGSAGDPFAGLSLRQAEIKNLTDYTIPALQSKLDELKKSGTAKEIADASLALIEAQNNLSKLISDKSDEEKQMIDAKTEAYKNYKEAIEGVTESKQSLADLEDTAYEDLQNAGTDVAAAREILRGYNRNRMSLTKDYASDVYDARTAAGTYNSLQKGIAPEYVKGTSEYTAAQAQAAGTITISGNIYLNGDKSFENYLSQLRTSQGIRNQ